MIDVSSAQLKIIVVHRVGNKIREEGMSLAETESSISDSLRNSLAQHYLLPLSKQGNIYDFFHESDASLNTLSNISNKIFEKQDDFIKHTQGIAKHLYSTSTHPNIQGGELVFLLFSGIKVEDSEVAGLAILKIESKDEFINIRENSGSFEIIEQTGISLSKIQKGTLILSDSKGVFVVDNLGQKTKYWMDSFLKVSPRATSKSYAKIGGAILKGIVSRVEDAQAAIDFSEKITEIMDLSEVTTIGNIKTISSQYIDSNSLSEIISGVTSSTGVDISDNYEFKSQDFAKLANPITKNIKIRSGVGLVVSDPSYFVSGLRVIDQKNGFQAIIDLEKRKGK
ncbi:nucleoid-associated protein [Aeromonas salmonicida]|uniref:nucleoid-associated protein n=1 Tax=Aeromonas salmonicida TaxID=645 RepID=UPI00223E9AA8|nr:nucleoid-associated protein [Aeromonas salmonicida]